MVDPATPEAPAEASRVGRRRFLAYLAAAPTLTIAARLAVEGEAAAEPAAAQLPLPPISEIADFGDVVVLASAPTSALLKLEFTEDNKILFELPRAEVGQGINTTAVMILAEELDAHPANINVQLANARPELLFNQFTGSSTSVRSLWTPLRTMAAGARARLITAAAERWQVSAKDLTTRDTSVVGPNGLKATFGSLAKDAGQIRAAAVSAAPKAASKYTVVGKPMVRPDARSIVTGATKYVSDLKLPGSVATVVVRPPTLGGTVASIDDAAARRSPGVVAVTQIPTGVAVSAGNFYQALQAKEALKVTWNPGPVAELSDSDIQAKLAGMTGNLAESLGLDSGGDSIDESFDFAFVNHAPMEVEYAVADVKADRADVWYPAQTPQAAQKEVAKAVDLPLKAVTLHVSRAGGSFGRHLFFDAAMEAAQVSKAIGKPVELMWTRNDDMRHGRMRPASHHRIRASHRSGKVRSFQHQMSSVQVDLSHGAGDLLTSELVKLKLAELPVGQLYFELSQNVPYDFGSVAMSLNELDLEGVPTGSWRSVHSATFRTAEELVVDQMAEEIDQDPVEFRLQSLKSDRTKNVLRKVAKDGKWGRSMPKGCGQGVAVHEEFRSVAACLVEINAVDPRNPRVTKAVMAADVGLPINPRGVQAQLSGGLMDAISTVLHAGIHIDGGAVREGSFSDFKWARQRHIPVDLQVHVMPATTGDPGGAGELGVPLAAAAVATAYARATGTRPRRFPINF
ncbi:molybdopterin-dependent oxidoreductase [Saccharopolyspora sp. K220]|uniref:xanthine dehydrogenase family protein molybdopterin-binding subunit n=1 Tax=Saccharopolyspora soli TaxID=2926618 RepID=UPI001F595CB9|nr:molybdopterin cofactor-binding domain-containing protein [Saccharopolyspora soli]MCI2419455.1 molybdopterin-dependent oxidoreductase [Saccharopolyspora soli]